MRNSLPLNIFYSSSSLGRLFGSAKNSRIFCGGDLAGNQKVLSPLLFFYKSIQQTYKVTQILILPPHPESQALIAKTSGFSGLTPIFPKKCGKTHQKL